MPDDPRKSGLLGHFWVEVDLDLVARRFGIAERLIIVELLADRRDGFISVGIRGWQLLRSGTLVR